MMMMLVNLAALVGAAIEVHPLRSAQIEDVNSKQSLWRAKAHPRFASQAPGASLWQLGVQGDWTKDIKASIGRGEVQRYRPAQRLAVPESWDAASAFPKCAKVISDIRDQSNCGCCWAFGGAEAASDRMCIASNASLMMPLSAQDVCFNSNFNGCGGGQISTPWNYMQKEGIVTGGQYQDSGPFGKGFCTDFSLPHCHHHGPTKGDPYPAEGDKGCEHQSSPKGPSVCDASAAGEHANFTDDKYTYTGQTQSASGEDDIKQFMMEGGPCEVAFSVYSDFENYDTGIYKHTSGSQVGGHAVKFVGWGVDSGVKYWKVANSWNPYWGEKGYFRIAMGEGGIDNECIASPASAKFKKMPPGPRPSPGPSPPGPGPSPPTPKGCEEAMTKYCASVKGGKGQCMICMGQHSMDLFSAGCSGVDEFKFCGLI